MSLRSVRQRPDRRFGRHDHVFVPQSMAYAMLAGLPPQVGLYASIVPLILYAMLGTSNSLAVGPVAMVSLLVFAGVGRIGNAGQPRVYRTRLTLALMIGVLHIAMAVFRLGFLVNFISHPVLVGFTAPLRHQIDSAK
ncbi:MAG: SulP family inorganic anion transporter [Pirellulaceae bacterium]